MTAGCAPLLAVIAKYGRFWYFFPQQCIGFNDIAAFFVGRAIGRTKLIRISPNKTLEGFLGGGLFNIFTAWYYSGYMLRGLDREWWICGSFKYDLGLWENYTCKGEVHSFYQM
jgi:phosphatidate cytidylyltransferase